MYSLKTPDPVMRCRRADSGYVGCGLAIAHCRACSALRCGPAKAGTVTSMTAATENTKMRRMFIRLTRLKISDGWRERAWLRGRGCSYHELGIRTASRSLH